MRVQMSMRLDKAPFSGVKLLLITKSVPLKGSSITFSKQGCFHTHTPYLSHPPHTHTVTHSRPFSLGAHSPRGPTDGGMRRDKLVVGLHQHMRLGPERVELQTGCSGAQWEWEWERGWDGAAQTQEAANLPPAGLLMPTICVCKSSPGGRRPRQAHTQANKHPGRSFSQLTLYLAPVITHYQSQDRSQRGHCSSSMHADLILNTMIAG